MILINTNQAAQFYRSILENFKNEYIHKRSLEELNTYDYSVVHEKDEVKLFLYLDNTLIIKNALILRHPFPGPGLSIRIPGKITKEKDSPNKD